MVTKIRMYDPGVIALQEHVDHKIVRPLTEMIAADMRRYVPVDTGDLLETIRTEFPEHGHGLIWFGDIAEGVDYHLYVEYGTSRMAAEPYARPAAYQKRSLT